VRPRLPDGYQVVHGDPEVDDVVTVVRFDTGDVEICDVILDSFDGRNEWYIDHEEDKIMSFETFDRIAAAVARRRA